MHKRGGFELRSIVTNCETVRAQFIEGEIKQSSVSLEPEPTTQKILGMAWETSDDTLRFQTRFGRVRSDVVDGSKRPTKREILSLSMSIFDPFGIFTLISKLILQYLWRADL